jgi:uncharacterized protein
MTMTQLENAQATQITGRRAAPAVTPLIDCDVHNTVEAATLKRYLPERWARHLQDFGLRAGTSTYYVRPRALACATDSWLPDGRLPGSDRAFMVDQLLDVWGHTYAILNPLNQLSAAHQPAEFCAALEAAVNDALVAEWVDPDPRFYASICVPFEYPDLAVAEIERLAPHPRFVQVLFNVVTQAPVGNRRYWPIYEAATRHDLPIALHVAGASGYPMTGCGWPSFYYEDHSGYQQSFLDQVTSLIAEGVFERFPTLKVVLQEGGFTWMLPLMWRLDRSYRLLREHLPPLERLPSEYCREHFWFTTQPIEEPEKPEYFMQMVDRLGMDDRYLFASDYPHWDFDAPDQALPASVPAELRRKIFSGNALQLYSRLPAVAA